MEYSEFPVFRGLNPTQIENFVSSCEEVTVAPKTSLIQESTRGHCMYFVLSGDVRVFMDGQDDRELARLSGPCVIGEMEFLTGKPRTASVETLTETVVFRVAFDKIRSRVNDGDIATLKILYNIGQVVANRLAVMDEKLSEIYDAKGPARREDLVEFHRKLFSDWSL